MPRKAKELGPLAVRNLSEPGLHFVGEVPGLALQILPTGAKTWILRVSVGGRRRDMGLGGYPEVTLQDARNAARKARERIRDGFDPIEERRAARSALAASAAKLVTFKAAALSYIADHEGSWKNPKHRQQWRNTLDEYAHPKIGDLNVRDIETPHVLEILRPIWRDKPETASRLRGRIEAVLDSAKAAGLIPDPWTNPARWRGHLDKLLPRTSKVGRVEHHAALPIAAAGAFMAQLRAADGLGALALEFAILTAARSGEVRGATWDEIDLEQRLWTVPASRMKAGKEHRVPLSAAALAVLERAPKIDGSPLVFTAARGGPLSDMTLTAVLRRLNVDAVPHGFRSTFRDWAAERTSYASEVCEMALAHAVGNKVEAAYRRGDMFEKRRRLMEDWAGFLSRPDTGGEVVPLRRAHK